MKHTTLRFIAAAVLMSATTFGWAEKVYRCGNAYSQSPCASARAIDVGDERTAADRAEALRRAQADRRLGDSMERSRLRAEAVVRPAAATEIGPVARRAVATRPVVKKRIARPRQLDEVVAIDPTTLKRRRAVAPPAP